MLDGSGSVDPDGTVVLYSWSQTSGPRVALSDPTSPTPTFKQFEPESFDVTYEFELVVSDGFDLSAPDTVQVIIDGYGNGWYLDSGGQPSVRIHVEWTPQRIVWAALAVSAAAVLACLVLVVIGDRRRRGALMLDDDPERPFDPHLDLGVGRISTAASPRAALFGAIGLAVFAALSLPFGAWSLVAPLLGVAGWAAYRSPRGRSLLTLSALAAYGLAAGYIVTSQWRHDYRSDFNWPTQFERVHEIGLLAIFLLFADAIRDLLPKTRKSET
jgi:uncharacterized membrane protein